jgi:hypothetical protein
MNRLRNSKIGWGLVILTLTLLSFVPVQPALADIALHAEPLGSNISPADSTQVQPVDYQSRPRLAAEFALAGVKASFSMRNQSQAAEQLQVRFPLKDPSGMGDGFGHYPEIQDIRVRVNEKATTPSPTPLPMRTSTALHTATPVPTPSPALAQLSTPEVTPPSTAVKVARVTPLSSTPSIAFPTTFIAGAFLVGLCIIVLVALVGVGLAVWYLRRDVKNSENTGRITKNDESP